MPRDPKLYLTDIVEHCAFLFRWRGGVAAARIEEEWETRPVIERAVQNIGEAVFQLRRIRPNLAARITHSEQVIGTRHILVHGYHLVKARILHDILHEELEMLHKEASEMLDELQGNADRPLEGSDGS